MIRCSFFLAPTTSTGDRTWKHRALVNKTKQNKLLVRNNMAIRTSCCFSVPPPGSPSISTTTITNKQVPWLKNEKWRSRCAVSMACMIIGFQVVGNESLALARDMVAPVVAEAESKENKSAGVPRWSDRRTCPPWHQNSLETIVPENLPRPSAHRRWEAVGLTSKKGNAPAVKVIVVVEGSNRCFSM